MIVLIRKSHLLIINALSVRRNHYLNSGGTMCFIEFIISNRVAIWVVIICIVEYQEALLRYFPNHFKYFPHLTLYFYNLNCLMKQFLTIKYLA